MRKLVTLRKIADLTPIPDADLIEVATIDGWKVVVKKGEFNIGDDCLYFEIDSFLPDGVDAWQFLVDKQPREFEGVRGHRLRTIKLRGQISQGFVIKPHVLSNGSLTGSSTLNGIILNLEAEARRDGVPFDVRDVDFAPFIGVKKWEAPIPTELAGQVEGEFPSFIRKTDQERCQNILHEIFVDNLDSQYEVSVKLDGTSCTIFHNQGKMGVCSRNWELKINEENANNSLVKIMKDLGLDFDLPTMGNFAIQGELMGPGIQGNREKLSQHELFVFDVFNIDEQRYLNPDEREAFIEQLMMKSDIGCKPIRHVPILFRDVTLHQLGIDTVDQLLAFAEGPSISHPVREGLVFKRKDGGFSFKAISNSFLTKEKD